jgi:hypothetical protein
MTAPIVYAQRAAAAGAGRMVRRRREYRNAAAAKADGGMAYRAGYDDEVIAGALYNATAQLALLRAWHSDAIASADHAGGYAAAVDLGRAAAYRVAAAALVSVIRSMLPPRR